MLDSYSAFARAWLQPLDQTGNQLGIGTNEQNLFPAARTLIVCDCEGKIFADSSLRRDPANRWYGIEDPHTGLRDAATEGVEDRIIEATALVEGRSLLTADRGIRRSRALHTIW